MVIEIDRYDGVFLLKEHGGDLYFLFHNFGVQIIPLADEITYVISISSGINGVRLAHYTS